MSALQYGGMFPIAAGSERPKQIPLGLLAYCFGIAQKAGNQIPGTPKFSDPLVFIQEAARVGANAVQIPFGVRDADSDRELREPAEKFGVALEATLSLPQNDSDLTRFEAEMSTLHEIGIAVARTVVFPGRRYEDLHSVSAFERAATDARSRIRRAEPIARKQKIRLAIENHKDQRIDERVRLLKEFASEFIGACVDVGNNIALLEDPVEVCRALAPWAMTVHFKDQGVREYEDGFLLADVPLGEGCIDLPGVIAAIREKKRDVHFQLELITRDALKVPVLTDRYWSTFPDVKAAELSRTWAMLKQRGSRDPFPALSKLPLNEQVAMERRNIEQSFRYAAEHLNFSV
jgi:sugar phosphate isomerase/epimerase